MTKLLINLSGARPEILAACPSERVKFQSMGSAILISSGVAAVSMWFALTSALGVNQFLALLLGLVWGLIITGIDRWMVTSMQGHGRRRWEIVVPRLVLAVLLGSLISTPIVLRIFQPEINAEIAVIKQQRASAFLSEQQLSPVNQQFTYWRNEVASLEEIIASGGTSARYQQAISALPSAQKQLSIAETRLNALQQSFDVQNENLGGFLVSLQALNQLASENISLNAARLLVFLLFLVIECLPVTVKLLQPPGNYEKILDEAVRRELMEAMRAFRHTSRTPARATADVGMLRSDSLNLRDIWQGSTENSLWAETTGPIPRIDEPEESDEHTRLDDQALREMEDIRTPGDFDLLGGTGLTYREDDL